MACQLGAWESAAAERGSRRLLAHTAAGKPAPLPACHLTPHLLLPAAGSAACPPSFLCASLPAVWAPGKPHTPDVIPTTSHLPSWNTMAMFVVQPGRWAGARRSRGAAASVPHAAAGPAAACRANTVTSSQLPGLHSHPRVCAHASSSSHSFCVRATCMSHSLTAFRPSLSLPPSLCCAGRSTRCRRCWRRPSRACPSAAGTTATPRRRARSTRHCSS